MTSPSVKIKLRQVWWTGLVLILTCIIFILVQHCYKQVCPLMSHLQPQGCWLALLIYVDPGTMAPAVGPLVNAATAIAVKNVKESTNVSTVPFRPHSAIVSTRGQPPCHGVNASGVSVVARSSQPTLRKNFVHNVDIPRAVKISNVVFPVPVNVVTSTQDFCD